jgi:hypothetical protein
MASGLPRREPQKMLVGLVDIDFFAPPPISRHLVMVRLHVTCQSSTSVTLHDSSCEKYVCQVPMSAFITRLLIANSSSVIMSTPLPSGEYFIRNKHYSDNFAGHLLVGRDTTYRLPIIGTPDRLVVSLMLSVSRLRLTEPQLFAVEP